MKRLFAISAYWANLVCVWLYLRTMGRTWWQAEPVIALGTGDGVWQVPPAYLTKGGICYCVGVGENCSFDLALSTQFGSQVWSFDPTPRAKQYLKRLAPTSRHFHFEPVGVWETTQTMKFYAPAQTQYVSHSVVNLFATQSYFLARCVTLSDLMRQHHHRRLNLLKLDVEGAEYAICRSMIRDGIRPRILCLELDQPARLVSMLALLADLHQAGYRLVSQDHWNLTWVYEK